MEEAADRLVQCVLRSRTSMNGSVMVGFNRSPPRCHPERSAAKSKDPVALAYRITPRNELLVAPRDSSTSLGMTRRLSLGQRSAYFFAVLSKR